MNCARCSTPARKVPWSQYVEGFDKGADEGERRATLGRDVAEVAREAHERTEESIALQEDAAEFSGVARYEAIWGRKRYPYPFYTDERIAEEAAKAARFYVRAGQARDAAADCNAWLARARAALEGE